VDDVIKSFDLAGGRVTLFEAAGRTGRAENLVCLNADGSLRWRAALPVNTLPDSFVDVILEDDCVRASAWSGWIIWFDCATGRAQKSLFAK
jgi:hypothetical protein